ncbi:MAG: DUF309 domain-containing protein [Chloroflexota bacterium]|nr:DUF309 domain-containing protein [Chloroflexota bacterium]
MADTVLQGGRAKAYRPLSEADRRAAFEAGLAAYRRGDFFEAHELLEPAWMGTGDPAERALHQGLIKLAAGYVHALRGNPEGMTKNLRGAHGWFVAVVEAGTPAIARSDVDVAALVEAIDVRLEALDRTGTIGPIDPPSLTGAR